MCQILLDMKTGILLYLFFASSASLVTSDLENFNSQIVPTHLQTLKSNTFNGKLESWIHLLDKKIKKFENVNDGFSIPINTDEEDFGTKVNSYNKELPAFESEHEYQGMKEENKFRDTPNQFELSTNQKNGNYLQQLVNDEKMFLYPESYYPTLHRRNHFNVFGQNLYDPGLYPEAYNARNFGKRFMNRKRHPKFLLDNQEHIPQEEIAPFYPGGNTLFSKDYSLPGVSNVNEKSMVLSAEPANGIPENPFIKPSKRSRVLREYFKRTNLNINRSASGLNEIATRNGKSENNEFKTQEMAEYNNPNADVNKILFPHSDDLHFLKKRENASEKNASPSRILQLRLERKSAKDDAKDSHNLLYNRVYFEKIPHNLNLSWFVYVNCSRDRCLLSNSADEIELLNEGWIMYNCTYYGCTEMHPRVASIKKYIGLILLVFSICVLKIIAFLALFYYCRRMKKSKNAPDDPDKWDEEKADSRTGEEKSLEKDYTDDRKQTDSTENFESASPNQKSSNSKTEHDEELNSLSTHEPYKEDSNVVPCLINSAPSRNILIPQRSFGNAIPKCKQLRSSIPRLEKWKTGNGRKSGNREVKKVERRKTPKRAKTTPVSDGDFILLNMDEEENRDGSCIPGKTEKLVEYLARERMQQFCKY